MRRRFRFMKYIIFLTGVIVLTGMFVLLVGRIDETIEANGVVDPMNHVEVKSRISGLVEKVLIEEGEKVEAGQPLLVLDTGELELRIETARQNLMNAKTELRQLEDEYVLLTQSGSCETAVANQNLFQLQKRIQAARTKAYRAEVLYQKKFISEQERDEAKLAWELLKAEYEAMQRRIELLKGQYQRRIASKKKEVELAKKTLGFVYQKLEDTRIIAPISGSVLTPNVEELRGTVVREGEVVLEIGDLSKMNFIAYVGESEIPKVKIGQGVRIFINAFPYRKYKVFTGKVVNISLKPVLTKQGIAFETQIEVDEPWVSLSPTKFFLKPGLSGKAVIITKQNVRLVKKIFEGALKR